jgi:hypothetical protein
MPSVRVRPLLVVLAVLAAFGAGVIVSARLAWLQPFAVITIQNRSGQQLRSLELQFESATARGVLTLPGLVDGASVDARMHVRGEGGYTVRAVLFDGTAPTPAEGYVETGYHVTEVVGQSRIEPASPPTYRESAK